MEAKMKEWADACLPVFLVLTVAIVIYAKRR
jgi:hypothetical protein